MALSSDNVKTIRLIADKLEKWAENVTYDIRSVRNLWVELTLSLYPHNVHGIASWLANIPATGQQTGKEFEELSELVQKIDAWRNHGVYPEDLGDYCACINRLMKVTRDIISLLRDLSGSEESKPETKAVTVEESNTTKTQEIKPAPTVTSIAANKSLPKEALMAYKLHYEMGMTIQQIAKRMTTELKLEQLLRPWQISRWIKQVESQSKHSRIPIRSITPEASDSVKHPTRTDTTRT